MTETGCVDRHHLGGHVFCSERSVVKHEISRRIRRQRLRHIQLVRGPGDTTPAAGAQSGPAVATPAVPGAGDDAFGRAWRALAMGDYHTAAHEAGTARQRSGDTPAVCSILARANAGLGRLEEAVVEAHRAVRLEPRDAEHHLMLGGVLEELGNWQAALQCYQNAARLAPGSDAPLLGTAALLTHLGDVDQALVILEAIYRRNQGESVVGDQLSLALAEAAEQVPQVRDDETYLVTSPQEIALMRTLLRQAAEVTRDPDLQADIASIRHYVDRCARRELLFGRVFGSQSGRVYLASAAGVSAVVAVLPLAGRVPVPVLLVAVLVAVLGLAGLVRHACVPRWKLNRRAYERHLCA